MPPKGRRAEGNSPRKQRVRSSNTVMQSDPDQSSESNSEDAANTRHLPRELVESQSPVKNRQTEPISTHCESSDEKPDHASASRGSSPEGSTPAERDSITNRNRTESTLLRLPAELRNQIWDLAFGHRTVHPRALRGNIDWQPQRRRLNASKWGVSYDPCMEKQSDYETYRLSLQVPEADFWHADMRPDLGAPGFHDCEQAKPRTHHYLVPPICKQLWNEASDCVWKTITFAFLTSGDFQHFVHFSGARLGHIRQLCLITPGIDFFAGRALTEKDKFERGWERALRSGAMQQFTSLVGLHLVLRSFWGTSRWDTHTVEELEFPPDECLYLPDIVRVFQELRLRPERTTVLVTNAECSESYGWEEFTVPKRRRMAQKIRNLLLQDRPDCDWSGLGQSMVVWNRD